ncbi:hypothetical protein BBJK_01965 [Bifidobacterium bifidum LMG 13195]|uniref:Uncharacterized protein n=1 Tax=Bifidobacterium bifidum LMG 13195 TaxID=1207542 RepID=A0A286TDF6_BIFBI|nr:hypothetical protein BBJK_01965 [Bifidobacterium bifidum LMG 13195]
MQDVFGLPAAPSRRCSAINDDTKFRFTLVRTSRPAMPRRLCGGTGRVGVCMSSRPGATNMITQIADANMIPCRSS